MEFTVQNIYGLLIRSQLLPLDDARQMFERWERASRGDSANVGKFMKWMVGSQYLTEYQASLLARGHADCFFVKQYKILDRVGRGRMAGVYKAVHQLGHVVAIKVLPPSKAKDSQILARFQREARFVQRLKHPNVVRSFQVGEANGLHFIVMEYLEGETLDEVLQRRGKLPPAEAARIVYQSLAGLQHIHEQGLIHRDMKPANLMLVYPPGQSDATQHATVKILDIGLGRAVFDETAPSTVIDPELTGEGMLLGTPDYLAPEQGRDAHTADIRSDIYSLGCVLYQALTGQTPFPDTNVISQMIRHATEQPRPVKELNQAVPDGLQQIISRMMAKDPAQRFSIPEQAAQALQPFINSSKESPPVPEANQRLRAFLTWLETENGKEDPSPAAAQPAAVQPSPAAMPVGASKGPVAPAPAAKLAAASAVCPPESGNPAQPAVLHSTSGKKHRSRKHKKKSLPIPAVPGVGPLMTEPRPAMFDVELVPPPPPPLPPGRLAGLRLTRRDLIMLGIGAGSILGAILVGAVLARFIHF